MSSLSKRCGAFLRQGFLASLSLALAAIAAPAYAQSDAASAASGAAVGARAAEPVQLIITDDSGDLLDAGLPSRVLTAAEIENLRVTRLALLPTVWAFDGTVCFVNVGPSTPVNLSVSLPRTPFDLGWAASAYRPREPVAAACNRAFEAALRNLSQLDPSPLSMTRLQVSATRTGVASHPQFSHVKAARQAGTVALYTGGTLSDAGKELIANTMGDRWTTIMDHRNFAIRALVMGGVSLEGARFCVTEVGVAARAPDGFTDRQPSSRRAFARTLKPDAPKDEAACSLELLESTVRAFRDTYEEDGIGGLWLTFEPGMKYPSVAEIKKTVAQYDAKQKQFQRRREMQVASTRSTNVLRCTNRCYNGSCTRTLEDGRTEQWQAPRVFNPMTSNWEWDTMTNACGR